MPLETRLTPELKAIIEDEAKHFPIARLINFFLTLAFLFGTSMLVGNKYQSERLVDPVYSFIAFVIFVIYSLLSTLYNAKRLRRINFVKKRDGYIFDPSDITFEDNKSILVVVIYCFFAGTLGGIVGIAGGIILGPLFL